MAKSSGSKSVRSGRGGVVVNTGAPGWRTVVRGAQPVSPLLRQLAAKVWDEVTEGKGVVLDPAGRPVEPSEGGHHG